MPRPKMTENERREKTPVLIRKRDHIGCSGHSRGPSGNRVSGTVDAPTVSGGPDSRPSAQSPTKTVTRTERKGLPYWKSKRRNRRLVLNLTRNSDDQRQLIIPPDDN